MLAAGDFFPVVRAAGIFGNFFPGSRFLGVFVAIGGAVFFGEVGAAAGGGGSDFFATGLATGGDISLVAEGAPLVELFVKNPDDSEELVSERSSLSLSAGGGGAGAGGAGGVASLVTRFAPALDLRPGFP